MPDLRLPPFRIIHAAYVASDFEAGKRRLAGTYGIESFVVFHEVPVEVPGGAAIISVAVGEAGGTTLEIIRPTGGEDHVYRQLLRDDPGEIAFHHFATRIENEAEWDMVHEAAVRHRLDVPVGGEVENGTSYVYLDTREALGHMLEFIWMRRPVDFSDGGTIEPVRW